MFPRSSARWSRNPSRVVISPLKSDFNRALEVRGPPAKAGIARVVSANRARKVILQVRAKAENSLKCFPMARSGPEASIARAILELLPRPEILNRRRALQANVRAGILVHALS